MQLNAKLHYNVIKEFYDYCSFIFIVIAHSLALFRSKLNTSGGDAFEWNGFTNLGDFFAADFWFCATRIVENVEFEMTSAIPDNFLFSFIEHAGEKMVLCTNMFCKALQGKGLNLHKTKRVLNKFHAAEINQKTSRNLFLLAL